MGVDCPFCGTVGKWHLGIHRTQLFATCWRCGPHKLAESLALITGREEREFYGLLEGRQIEERRRPVGRLRQPANTNSLLAPHRQYLRQRGFDPDEIVRLWGVQGIGPAPRLAWRLWIPIHHNGEIVSWTTRAISDQVERRYIHASPEDEKLPSGDVLYGASHARHAVVVCEGPLDAWKIGPGGVCTLGVGFSQAQVEAISRYPVRAICFDNEPAAQRRARDLIRKLTCFDGETVIIKLDSKDPGEARDYELNRIRKEILE